MIDEGTASDQADKEKIAYQGCRCMGQGECEFCATEWDGFGDPPSVVKARRDTVRAFNKYNPKRT